MLNSLLTTCVICLGLSNSGNPISNYKEQNVNNSISINERADETQVVPYEMAVGIGNESSAYHYEQNGSSSPIPRQKVAKYRLSGNNSALSINGMHYYQFTWSPVGTPPTYNDRYTALLNECNWENYNDILNGRSLNPHGYAMYALSIEPYNINIETDIEISLVLNCQALALATNQYTKQLHREVYNSVDNGLIEYMDVPLVANVATVIQDRIESIDNGYYYNKTEETIQLSSETNQVYTDTFDITITPNKTNYLVVVYKTGVLLQGIYTINTEYPNSIEIQSNAVVGNHGETPIYIHGTNIIPSGTYEVIDIPDIMFTVLTMPFSFVSTAFNLTLFPGTQYQINIANLFLGIIAVFVFVFIVKLITNRT